MKTINQVEESYLKVAAEESATLNSNGPGFWVSTRVIVLRDGSKREVVVHFKDDTDLRLSPHSGYAGPWKG